MNSDNYSYNKQTLITSIILGLLLFSSGFGITILLQKFITFQSFVKKSLYYRENLKKFTCMPIEQQNELGYTYFQNIIINLNTYTNPTYTANNECDKITLENPSKLYIFIYGIVSLFLLFRLITNFTINTIVGNTVSSNVNTTPAGINNYNVKTKHFSIFLEMVGYYLLNILFISIPVIFMYFAMGREYFNISKIVKIKGELDTNTIIRLIISISLGVIFLLGPVIYTFISLFIHPLTLLSNTPVDTIIFPNNVCKNMLKKYFNIGDHPFVNKLYKGIDDIGVNLGIWIIVCVIIFIIQAKNIYNPGNNNNTKYYLILFAIIFLFCLYITYRKYNVTINDENNTFDQNIFNNDDNNDDNNGNIDNTNHNLTEQMYSKSINNIFQGIVKYNYPCMPFNN